MSRASSPVPQATMNGMGAGGAASTAAGHGPRRTSRQRGEGFVDVARYADRRRIEVAGPTRDDSHRDPGPGQDAGRVADRPVAAGERDDRRPIPDRVRRGIAYGRRRARLHDDYLAVAPSAERLRGPPGDLRPGASIADPGRKRADDDGGERLIRLRSRGDHPD